MSRYSFVYRGMSFAAFLILGMGCGNQGNDRLAERARIEGKEQALMGLMAQNTNLAEKATQMEEDLASRHAFFQAVQGSYEGTFITERGEFRVRITLIPSLPPYLGSRVRQLDEIAFDLNNLYLNAQVVQWNPANLLSSVGCLVENMKPEYNKGQIVILSTSCGNVYQLSIADEELERITPPDSTGKKVDGKTLARSVSNSIREGLITQVPEIRGEVRPTTNASVYDIVVKRVER